MLLSVKYLIGQEGMDLIKSSKASDHEFACHCLIQLNSNEKETLKWLRSEGQNCLKMPNGKNFVSRSAAAVGKGISGKLPYLRKNGFRF